VLPAPITPGASSTPQQIPRLGDVVTDELDARLNRIGQQRLRAKFRLQAREHAIIDQRGMITIREHAAELIKQRLAPAAPRNDGRQTPYRGHPVFVAQHATATCCRTCLSRWHSIPAGRALHPEEQAYVVNVICRWIARQHVSLPLDGWEDNQQKDRAK